MLNSLKLAVRYVTRICFFFNTKSVVYVIYSPMLVIGSCTNYFLDSVYFIVSSSILKINSIHRSFLFNRTRTYFLKGICFIMSVKLTTFISIIAMSVLLATVFILFIYATELFLVHNYILPGFLDMWLKFMYNGSLLRLKLFISFNLGQADFMVSGRCYRLQLFGTILCPVSRFLNYTHLDSVLVWFVDLLDRSDLMYAFEYSLVSMNSSLLQPITNFIIAFWNAVCPHLRNTFSFFIDMDMAAAFDPMWRNLEKCLLNWSDENGVGGNLWDKLVALVKCKVTLLLLTIRDFVITNTIKFTNVFIFKPICSVMSYTYSNVVGTHTLFIVTLSFILFTLVFSSNTLGMLIKFSSYIIICVIYLLVLNLDPWSCFLIVVEFSALFLLTVVLNSMRLRVDNTKYLLFIRSIYFFIFFFLAALTAKLPNSNMDSFYINVCSKSMYSGNVDFFGVFIELFVSPIILTYVIVLLTVISVYIIARFKLRSYVDINTINPYHFLCSVVGTDYKDLIDCYFLHKRSVIKKWFRF